MAEEKKIVINYQGREVKQEQLISYHGQQGEIIHDLQRKNCKLIFNSTGEKNVIAVADQHGKVNWLGTYSSDIKIQCVDLVMFKEGYMTRFNCATVLDAEGIRYEVPAFNYFENELIPEETDTEIESEIAPAVPAAAPVVPAAVPAAEPVAPAEPAVEESEADF